MGTVRAESVDFKKHTFKKTTAKQAATNKKKKEITKQIESEERPGKAAPASVSASLLL